MNYLFQNFRRHAALLALLGCLATTHADPYAASLDHLEGALKQRVETMAEGAQDTAPAPMTTESLVNLTILVIVAILTWPFVLRAIQRRREARVAQSGDAPELLYLKEPTLASFLEQLNTGVTPPLAYDGYDPQNNVNPLVKFFETAPAEILKLQTLLVDASRTPDAATRRKKLSALGAHFKKLNYDACQLEMVNVWRLALALADLLKQLGGTENRTTATGLHTTAAALQFFRSICEDQVVPPLDKKTPAKFLVVAADAFCRAALSGALKKAFLQPDLAPDAATCLALAKDQTYDVIYLDLEMPVHQDVDMHDLSAFELCAKIRELDRNRTTPIVLLTPHDDFETHVKKVSGGDQHLLGKPFLFVEVVVQALTLVQSSRLERGAVTTKDASAKPEAAAKPAERQPLVSTTLICAAP